ncbi:MAG: hypothetical protein JW936_11835 [Sedimentisphaerales bacterium]|nr:hypothetical protein [Sedimentisphaerales bacterium]
MSNAWYALRRTIAPWRFQELADEVLESLPKAGVDELIAKIDSEEFTHGQPNLEWVKKYCRKLKPLKQTLEEKGIVFSLNPWITFGHCDRGRDGSVNIPGLQTMVDWTGIQDKCCACPLSPAWREHVVKVWTEYAKLNPAVIWLEDDLRTFNHRPVTISCFCDLHLARFSERIGEKVTREQLTAAIIKSENPHPWRKEYLDMQRDVILETVKIMIDAVQAVSPETSFGLMSSGPRAHCMEGRDWHKLADVMSPNGKLISRPPLGSYAECSLRGLYFTADSIKITRYVLPEGTIEQTEVENVPFTAYSKSLNFTFLQMAASYALGCEGVTMNLFDHCGSTMADDPDMLQMLASEKKYLNSLAAAAQGPARQRGVQLLFSTKHGYNKHLDNAVDASALAANDYWIAETLETLGLPTTYSDENVKATIGQMLRNYSDDEIKQLLSGGLFLDAVAASVLFERGFGDYIGIKQIAPPVCIDDLEPLSAEEYHNKSFGGAKAKMMTLTVPNLFSRPSYSQAQLSDKAKLISSLVDPDVQRKYPSMFAFENSLGGRVVVHLLDWTTACGSSFNNHYRREQLQNVMRWLSRDTLSAVVPDNVFPLLIRRDLQHATIATIFNLTLDPYPQAKIELYDQRQITDIHVLSPTGSWQCSKALTVASNKNHHSILYSKPLDHARPLAIRINFAQ